MAYAGDVSCAECWEELQQDQQALLIDVRTNAEWQFVGVSDLGSIGKRVILVDWQQFPGMTVNPSFIDQVNAQVEANGSDKEAKLYLLCRSGVRSIAAAEALTEAGYKNAFNVLGGFEGNPNDSGHRGNLQGWKFERLPWRQK